MSSSQIIELQLYHASLLSLQLLLRWKGVSARFDFRFRTGSGMKDGTCAAARIDHHATKIKHLFVHPGVSVRTSENGYDMVQVLVLIGSCSIFQGLLKRPCDTDQQAPVFSLVTFKHLQTILLLLLSLLMIAIVVVVCCCCCCCCCCCHH